MQQSDHEGTPGTPGEVELDAVARICAERHVQMQNSFDCLSAVANGSAIARSRSSCHTTRNISENTPSRNAANGTKALANSATLSLGHALQPTVQHYDIRACEDSLPPQPHCRAGSPVAG